LHAPKIVVVPVPEEKIGEIIGPGGKNIKRIQEETKSQINIEEDGGVQVVAENDQFLKLAVQAVRDSVAEAEEGKTYLGRSSVASLRGLGCDPQRPRFQRRIGTGEARVQLRARLHCSVERGESITGHADLHLSAVGDLPPGHAGGFRTGAQRTLGLSGRCHGAFV
jgi:hypothetical protein